MNKCTRISAIVAICGAVAMGCGAIGKSRVDAANSDLAPSDVGTADRGRRGDIWPFESGVKDTGFDGRAEENCGECDPGLECLVSWAGEWECLDRFEECANFCEWDDAKCGEMSLWWEDDAPECDCGSCPAGSACSYKHRCCLMSCADSECGETCGGTSCGKCDNCEDCVDGTCVLPETGSFCQTVACVADELYCEEGDQGFFGCECETDDDCWHMCISVLDGKVCTGQGGEECPQDWSMRGVTRGADRIFICVPQVGALCWPCHDDADCNAGLGWGTCIDRGPLGSFCATGCTCTSECHIGFACYPSEESDWGGGYCLPDSPEKECHCNPTAAEEELSTTCYLENEFGTCFGQRHCTEDGLTQCDAPEPLPETCNEVDDDCNGLVDDVDGCEA